MARRKVSREEWRKLYAEGRTHVERDEEGSTFILEPNPHNGNPELIPVEIESILCRVCGDWPAVDDLSTCGWAKCQARASTLDKDGYVDEDIEDAFLEEHNPTPLGGFQQRAQDAENRAKRSKGGA